MYYNQLTQEQRYAIYLGLQEKKSKKQIANQIGVRPSTVGREIRRNSNRNGNYGWRSAQTQARIRQERLPGKRAIKAELRREVLHLLVHEEWSPKQISGALRRQGKEISHETIYRMIRADNQGLLASHCRHRMKYRRRKSRRIRAGTSLIPQRVDILQRPPQADGSRFGDWEMDLIIGSAQKGALLTLCERSTNFLMIRKIDSKRPAEVARQVIDLLLPYKAHVLTITTDNGMEFAHHKTMAKALNTTVYFADPFASWQKGAIENANKLIRQYIPKRTDIRDLDPNFVHAIQLKINRRPREKLHFLSPKQCFFQLLL